MTDTGNPFDSVAELYRTQGVGGGTVGFGQSCALLLVDFQNEYTRGRKSCGLDAVERSRTVLDTARRAGIPVIYTFVAVDPGGSDFGVWGEKCPSLPTMWRGAHHVAIDEIVTPSDGDIVMEKHAPSAFFGTGLAELLRGKGVDTVITCGTSTSGCIRATVVDGVSHGFRMIVPEECVADRSAPSGAAALFDINAKYGDVVSTDTVLEHLSAPVARS